MKAYLLVFERNEKGEVVTNDLYGLRAKVAYSHELKVEDINWVKPSKNGQISVDYNGIIFYGDKLNIGNY